MLKAKNTRWAVSLETKVLCDDDGMDKLICFNEREREREREREKNSLMTFWGKKFKGRKKIIEIAEADLVKV